MSLLTGLRIARLSGVLGLKTKATAAAKGKTEPELVFEPAGSAPILFPELLEPGKRAVLVGIDPDIHGALAVLTWQNPGGSSVGSSGSSSSSSGSSVDSGVGSSIGSGSSSIGSPAGSGSGSGVPADLGVVEGITLSVHDMPVEIWELGTRSKRQPDPAALLDVVRRHASLGPGGGALGASEGDVVRAVVEHTTPQHLSGKHAWYGMGFSFGLLTGLLTAQGIPYRRVDASAWKRHLGLFRLGKEGSLALAKQLYPHAHDYLKHKKHHGRAEAMLIAAWGLGVRMAAGQQRAGGLIGDGAQAAVEDAITAASSESGGAGREALGDSADGELVTSEPPKKRRSRKKATEDPSLEGAGAAGDSPGSPGKGASIEAASTPVKRGRTRKKVDSSSSSS